MTADLYAALGVPKSADRATVRRAYRRASKKAHPDMPGGSGKRFALVKLAHDTLTDDARRAHYDQTGEADEKPPDNEQAKALECVAAALEAALAECQSNGKEPEHVDLVGRMRSWIKAHMAESDRQVAQIEKMIAKSETLGNRFSGEVMPLIITGRIGLLRGRIDAIRRNRVTGDAALALLEPAKFRVDPEPPASKMNYANLLGQIRF
jgi:curved DNA-binding protein CbpA